MTHQESVHGDNLLKTPQDFSLVLGGPLYQLLRRAHMADDALELARRRVVTIALAAWVPLLALSALEGTALGGSAAVPFLLDVEVHIRFLLVVPLLIAAELVVHRRMRFVVKQFLERNLIPESAVGRFNAAVAAAFRLRNSISAEVLLLTVVYVVGVSFVWRHYSLLPAATWYATPSAEGMKLTPSGVWYAYVSLPVFQFLLLRWYFRLFIWARLLWQVSRIRLSLLPIHPDRLGGIGFLADTAYAFVPLVMAHGAMLAGLIANRILHLGAALPDFKIELAVLVVFLTCLVFGPLLVFTPQLAQAKRTGLREYGALAQRYAREFDVKWLRGRAPAGEQLMGSPDIQSLPDLASSVDIVREMRIVVVTRDGVLRLAAAILAPILPLGLTMMSLEELVKRLFKIVF